MTKSEQEQLGYKKAYLAGILKSCWMEGILDKKTYMGLAVRLQTAIPEQVQEGIVLYRGKINALHDSRGQDRLIVK